MSIDKVFKEADKQGLKIAFGLVQQGHIPTIEQEIKRHNDMYKSMFPDEEPSDMTYSKHVWEGIGKIIGWCPFTAALYYLEYLNHKQNEPKEQKPPTKD